MTETSKRPTMHKRWNQKFLLKEIASRIPEHAGMTPERLAEYLAGDLRQENKVSAYADGDVDTELVDIALPLHWHAQLMMRRAEYGIYKEGTHDRKALAIAAWHEVLHTLLRLGRNVAGLGQVPCWSTTIRGVAESLAMAYALGWDAAGNKLGGSAIQLMPHGCLWRESDVDPRWEKNREPFARFTLALYADFANMTLPPLPPHPYASPAYDAMLACWRDPDPQALIEPLLNVCDWHTHECMYSRSDRPSKNVDFINDTLMGWPVEVHMIYRLRERLGFALPPELNHPLMQAPLGPYLPPQPVPHDERLEKIIRRAYAEVPGLEAVLAGVL